MSSRTERPSSEREHGSETLQVDVRRTDIMVVRHAQVACGAERGLWFFMSDVEERGLCGLRSSIHEIHDRALILADYCGVRLVWSSVRQAIAARSRHEAEGLQFRSVSLEIRANNIFFEIHRIQTRQSNSRTV